MRIFDRILFIMLAVVHFAAGILVLLSETAFESKVTLSGLLSNAIGNHQSALVVCAGAVAVLFIFGAFFISVVISSRNYVKDNSHNSIRMPVEGSGSASITVEAIRAIAKKKCLSFRFVSDCTTDVREHDGEIELRVKIKPYADVILPTAVKELQDELMSTVQAQTGIVTRSVSVVVLPYTDKKNR